MRLGVLVRGCLGRAQAGRAADSWAVPCDSEWCVTVDARTGWNCRHLQLAGRETGCLLDGGRTGAGPAVDHDHQGRVAVNLENDDSA